MAILKRYKKPEIVCIKNNMPRILSCVVQVFLPINLGIIKDIVVRNNK